MSREWKPGDVARNLGGNGLYDFTVFRDVDGWIWPDGSRDRGVRSDLRPVVVIDPEDREQVERLRDLWGSAVDDQVGPVVPTRGEWANAMQAALREFANPTPPKPDEPQGLGAVVEGADGRRWVRVEPDGGHAKWLLSKAPDAIDPRYVWSAVPAVRVLSEGWSA